MQIANFKVENSVKSLKITTFWDPSEPQATRPVSLTLAPNAQISGRLWSLTPETYYYSHDYTKNICELFSVDEQNNVNIVRSYDYSPFGAVTEHVIDSAIVNLENNFGFSSEFYDSEMALCYYNYRHYNPLDGRWINHDLIEEQGGLNLYGMIGNNTVRKWDYLGLKKCPCSATEKANALSRLASCLSRATDTYDAVMKDIQNESKLALEQIQIEDEQARSWVGNQYNNCRRDCWRAYGGGLWGDLKAEACEIGCYSIATAAYAAIRTTYYTLKAAVFTRKASRIAAEYTLGEEIDKCNADFEAACPKGTK